MKVAELDMTTLDAMELKNFLLKLLARAKSKTQLIRIIQHVEEVVEEDDAEDAETFWGRFTVEQRTELERSFEDSYNPDNWIAHEDMLKKHTKWLKK